MGGSSQRQRGQEVCDTAKAEPQLRQENKDWSGWGKGTVLSCSGSDIGVVGRQWRHLRVRREAVWR